MNKRVREVLEEMLEEFDGDMFALDEEYYGQGICFSCGELRGCVEPDATGYECDSCGKHAVAGITMALLQL